MKFIILNTKFSGSIQSLDRGSFCEWLKHRSGLSTVDLVNMKDVKVNVGPQKRILIKFADLTTDVGAILRVLQGARVVYDVIPDVSVCQLSACPEYRVLDAMIQGIRTVWPDRRQALQYYETMFQSEDVLLIDIELFHQDENPPPGLAGQINYIYLALPSDSVSAIGEWIRGRQYDLCDGTVAVMD